MVPYIKTEIMAKLEINILSWLISILWDYKKKYMNCVGPAAYGTIFIVQVSLMVVITCQKELVGNSLNEHYLSSKHNW